MTTLLYQTDSYLKEFDAEILSVDSEARTLVLNQTAFYPGGGGQPCDFGLLRVGEISFPVSKVKKRGVDVFHFIGSEAQLPKIGTVVHGEIDWERRYQLMRTHTAMHILCGVIFRDYGASVTGGNMELLKGRMDFEFETMRKELVSEIELAINIESKKDHDVKVAILPREEAFQIPDLIRTKINLLPEGIDEIRTIEIVGLDLQADGGTHVKNTSEVGEMRVTNYKSKGKMNKRIYVEVV
ncbi:MAG: alanyl-tRNA editing protein [Anaerolineae bacterium]|jgi:misacylated tRNA(Ala) deacylase|nr:alanyl-tRNA editing protein [Anaerolineae bacterium]MBT7783486.1 alanyl-tRNA editing protein [Anaerolineae bacterium]